MAATAKEFEMGKSANKIELKGDVKNPESAEHIIVFPGGSISVCRTSDNQYWAHISVNSDKAINGAGTRSSKTGVIEVIRVDTLNGVKEVEPVETDHFAVLISTSDSEKSESTKRDMIPGTQLSLI
jgi:hypothetical protein